MLHVGCSRWSFTRTRCTGSAPGQEWRRQSRGKSTFWRLPYSVHTGRYTYTERPVPTSPPLALSTRSRFVVRSHKSSLVKPAEPDTSASKASLPLHSQLLQLSLVTWSNSDFVILRNLCTRYDQKEETQKRSGNRRARAARGARGAVCSSSSQQPRD